MARFINTTKYTRAQRGDVTRRGFVLLDAIIGVGIASLLTFAFLASIAQADRAGAHARNSLIAQLMLLEANEVGYALARSDWSALDPVSCAEVSPCHPAVAGASWTLSSGSENINGFSRSIAILPVRRSATTFPNEIVESGGVIDPSTKLVRSTVSWTSRGTNYSETLDSYVYVR